MASKNKHRRHFKNQCVIALVAELWLCVLLICCTIGMQAYNLLSPPPPSVETPALIGEVTLPFELNSSTAISFLMLPLLLLVFLALFLQRYFARNGFGYSDKIPMFDKHPHTRLGNTACKTFSLVSVVVSFSLCCVCSALHGLHVVWFGLLTVSTAGYLHFWCSKKLRHSRRLYHHNKKKTKETA